METAGLFIVFLPLKPVSFLFKKIAASSLASQLPHRKPTSAWAQSVT
jgi:hypothetical protein